MTPKMVKNEVLSIEDEKLPTSLNCLQQLEQELKGNTHALNELKQLQLLFEYYNERYTGRTEELEKANTELKKQKQLAEHLAKIGELASSLTHNLRNPLGVISTTVEIIEATSKDSLDEKTLSRLSRITDAATNMSHQIEDVLNFVRNKPLDLEIVSFSKMLQSTINNLEIPERVNVHLPENDVSMECDHSKLEVVFVFQVLYWLLLIDVFFQCILYHNIQKEVVIVLVHLKQESFHLILLLIVVYCLR